MRVCYVTVSQWMEVIPEGDLNPKVKYSNHFFLILTPSDALVIPSSARVAADSGDAFRRCPPCSRTRTSPQLANGAPLVDPMTAPTPLVGHSVSRHSSARHLSAAFSGLSSAPPWTRALEHSHIAVLVVAAALSFHRQQSVWSGWASPDNPQDRGCSCIDGPCSGR